MRRGASFLRTIELLDNLRRYRLKCNAHRMRGIRSDDWTRLIAALAQLPHQRQLAKERHAERMRQPLAAAMRKELVAMVALAAQVIAHVLDHAEHRHMNFFE